MEFRVETDEIEELGSIYDEPPPFKEYRAGLTQYYIDNVPVTEDEFRKAIAKEKATHEGRP